MILTANYLFIQFVIFSYYQTSNATSILIAEFANKQGRKDNPIVLFIFKELMTRLVDMKFIYKGIFQFDSECLNIRSYSVRK